MIKCPNCTAELDFDAKDQLVKCSYCGSEFNPKEMNSKVKMAKEKKPTGEYEGKGYSCTQCGATLMTFDETAITFCSYCGSQAMIEEKMMKVNNPDFIIPFKITKEQCIEAYKNKIKKSLFCPNYLKQDVTLEKFRGIYMPYVIYKLGKNGKDTFKGEKYSHRSGNYDIYDKYTITANIDASYEGLSYDLLSKYYDKYSSAIPFNYKEKEEFNPNFLIGYYADAGDVDSSVYDTDVTKIASNDTTRFLRKYKEFGKYGCSSPKSNLGVDERKIGMFPVYFLAIRDNKNNINYAVVNGQTGKVVADIPISFTKYLVASAILSVITFLLINSFLILTPTKVTIFAIIMTIISLIYSIAQASQIQAQKNHDDDKGIKSVNKNENKDKDGVKWFKYMYKDIIALILPILVLIAHPVSDVYYYYAALASIVLVTLSFKDLVEEHNLLVSNKLPQLEKRGGEE